MKKKTIIIIIISVLLLVLISGFLLFRSGKLVTPTQRTLEKLNEVPSFDVLSWQFEREQEIVSDYTQGSYTFENPYVIVDPYEMNPLSALVIFEMQKPGDIIVTIPGDDDFATVTYTKSSTKAHFEIPIVGLYAGRENFVTLEDENGQKSEIHIITEPLPVDFQTFKVEEAIPELMEPGMTLFTACFEDSYSALLDANGDVRGYLSNQRMAHGTSMILLENGNMLSTGDEYIQLPYNMVSLWEFNWLGKVFNEYEIPNGVHHDIREIQNGNIIAASNPLDMFNSGTREDVVLIIDRQSAEISQEIDFRGILDENRDPYHHFHPNLKNPPNIDWLHINAAEYNNENNTIIISSATQSQVVCIDADTLEIQWILGPHEGYEGSAAFLKEYLLEPIGENFEWQWCQHHPMILPDADNDPETIDLILFDNGQNKSFNEENAVSPEDNYSRGVIYRVNQNDMTVEQIWQYGKECGSDCYATFLGDANYLFETGNRMMTFGGQLRVDGIPVDDIISGLFGDTVTNSRIVEITEDHQVVFEVSVWENEYNKTAETYQAKRIPIYSESSYDYFLSEVKGQRLGTPSTLDQNVEISAPNLFMNNFEIVFNKILMENDRLIIDGNMLVDGRAPLLGRGLIVLRSKDNVYTYFANSSIYGRFFASIDTSEMESGTYLISIAGATSDDNDVLNAELTPGHIKTTYKITIP
ncbi:MAG: aryl-sulfate sulfotransferase [Anaerolineaceae bacterium]|nr:aryl-sulfate sulfotransferase [Anaerolineaceae bacterium]